MSYLYDKHRFLSALALSLTAIIGMEMPFINAITKVDLLGKFGRPDMNLTFYNEISGLKYLFYECQEEEEDAGQPKKTPFQIKYGKLTSQLCELIENFNLVQYSLIDITNRLSMCHVLMQLDNANGYYHDPQKLANPKEMEIDYEAVKEYYEHEFVMDLEEKYLEREGSEGEAKEEDVEMK